MGPGEVPGLYKADEVLVAGQLPVRTALQRVNGELIFKRLKSEKKAVAPFARVTDRRAE